MDEFNFLNESEWYHRSYVNKLEKALVAERKQKERYRKTIIEMNDELHRIARQMIKGMQS